MIAPIRELEPEATSRRKSPAVRRAHSWVVKTLLSEHPPEIEPSRQARRAWAATAWIVGVAAVFAWHWVSQIFSL